MPNLLNDLLTIVAIVLDNAPRMNAFRGVILLSPRTNGLSLSKEPYVRAGFCNHHIVRLLSGSRQSKSYTYHSQDQTSFKTSPQSSDAFFPDNFHGRGEEGLGLVI
jgi:hypothetical protein